MRKFLLGAVASLAIAAGSGVQAADIEEPIVESDYDWTGLYVGVHAGYGWGSIDYEASLTTEDVETDPDGFLYGAHVGFNFQFDSFVIGPEVSFTATDLDDDFGSDVNPVVTFESEVDWYAIFGGRIGFALDRTLVYARGGYALIDVGTSGDNPGIPDAFDDSETHDGYAIGGGGEHAITDNFILGIEYMYVNVGDENHDGTTDTGIPYENSDVGGHIHAVTGRASFKFMP